LRLYQEKQSTTETRRHGENQEQIFTGMNRMDRIEGLKKETVSCMMFSCLSCISLLKAFSPCLRGSTAVLSARFGDVENSFFLRTGLCQELFPISRRIAAFLHLAENFVRILGAFVGSFCLRIIYPCIYDDFPWSVVAKKEAILLEKLGAKPMFLFFAKGASLAVFSSGRILWYYLKRQF
jgi:hypothetical protein